MCYEQVVITGKHRNAVCLAEGNWNAIIILENAESGKVVTCNDLHLDCGSLVSCYIAITHKCQKRKGEMFV